MNKEELLEKAQLIGKRAVEDIIKEVVIPFLEAKALESENKIDDMVMAAVKPTLLELADDIDGEEG